MWLATYSVKRQLLILCQHKINPCNKCRYDELLSKFGTIHKFGNQLCGCYFLLTSTDSFTVGQVLFLQDDSIIENQVSNRDCWGLQKNFNKCILSRRKQGIRVATICHCFHYFFVIPEETLSLNFHPKYQQLATNLNSKCCVVSTRHRYSEDFISGVFRV